MSVSRVGVGLQGPRSFQRESRLHDGEAAAFPFTLLAIRLVLSDSRPAARSVTQALAQ